MGEPQRICQKPQRRSNSFLQFLRIIQCEKLSFQYDSVEAGHLFSNHYIGGGVAQYGDAIIPQALQ